MSLFSIFVTVRFRSGQLWTERVDGLSYVERISSGAGWSAAVTRNGKLFTFGDGFYGQVRLSACILSVIVESRTVVHGQLGLGPKTLTSEPREVQGDFDDVGVRDVACGFTHTLVLANDGDVYSCGRLDCFAVG